MASNEAAAGDEEVQYPPPPEDYGAFQPPPPPEPNNIDVALVVEPATNSTVGVVDGDDHVDEDDVEEEEEDVVVVPPAAATEEFPPLKLLPSTYYALRRGKDGLRGCIFLVYEDIEPYIQWEDAEWKTFSDLESAALYIFSGLSSAADDDDNDHVDDDEHDINNTDEAKTKRPREEADSPPKKKKKKRRKRSLEATLKPQKANAYWTSRYKDLKSFQEKNEGRLDPTPDEDSKLAKFIKEQRTEYRFMMQGQESKMFQDKVDKLQALGFDFKYQEILNQENQEFEAMLKEMQQFDKDKAVGDSHKRQSRALADWKYLQRVQFQNLQEGKRSTLTPERIQKLNDAGFIFVPRSTPRTLTWAERMEQLKQYKTEHGDLNIPASHPELGYWVSNIRRGYKYLQDGKPTGFTQDKADQLQELGFSFLVGRRKTGPIEIKSWEESFQMLQQFKKEHGHTVVPQHYPSLGRWVKQMRREFKLMKEGKRTSLTQEKVLKLADIGFQFDALYRRGSRISSDDYRKVGGKLNEGKS